MGLFGDLDVESAADNPWEKPDGTYRCNITALGVRETRHGDKIGMNIEYTIVEGPKAKRKIKEWKWVPTKNQLEGFKPLRAEQNSDGLKDEKFAADANEAAAYLKARMKDFGIPTDKLNDLDAEDILAMNLDLDVTIQNRNGNEQIRAVNLHEETSSSDPFGSY